jgi:hypothetical protein
LKEKEERRRKKNAAAEEEWCTVALVSLEVFLFYFLGCPNPESCWA